VVRAWPAGSCSLLLLFLAALPAQAGNGDDGLELAEDTKAEFLLRMVAKSADKKLDEVLAGLARGTGVDKAGLSRIDTEIHLALKLVPKLSAAGDSDITGRIADEVSHLEAIVAAGGILETAIARERQISRGRGALSAQCQSRQVACEERYRSLRGEGAIEEDEFEEYDETFSAARTASRKSLDAHRAGEIGNFLKLADEARGKVELTSVRSRLVIAIRVAAAKHEKSAEKLTVTFSHLRYGDAGDPVFAELMKKLKSSEARIEKLTRALKAYEAGFSRRIDEELREIGLEVVAVREGTSVRIAEKVVENNAADFELAAREYQEWLDEVSRRRRRCETDCRDLNEEIQKDLSGALEGYIGNCYTDEERRVFREGFDRISRSLDTKLEAPLEALLAGWEDGEKLRKKIDLLFDMAGFARELEEWNSTLLKFFATVGTGAADLVALSGGNFEPFTLAASLFLKLPHAVKDGSYYRNYEKIRSEAKAAGIAEITLVNAPRYREQIDNCLDLFPLFNDYAGAAKNAAGWIRSMLDYWQDRRRYQQLLDDYDQTFDDSTPPGSCFERELDRLLLDDAVKLRAATEKEDFLRVLLDFFSAEHGKLRKEAGECPSGVARGVSGMIENSTRACTGGLGELSEGIEELTER
jgi:hypothetical protein